MKTQAKPTPRELSAYLRGERRLMEIAARRPILNPAGPTALIPARKRISVVENGQMKTRFAD